MQLARHWASSMLWSGAWGWGRLGCGTRDKTDKAGIWTARHALCTGKRAGGGPWWSRLDGHLHRGVAARGWVCRAHNTPSRAHNTPSRPHERTIPPRDPRVPHSHCVTPSGLCAPTHCNLLTLKAGGPLLPLETDWNPSKSAFATPWSPFVGNDNRLVQLAALIDVMLGRDWGWTIKQQNVIALYWCRCSGIDCIFRFCVYSMLVRLHSLLTLKSTQNPNFCLFLFLTFSGAPNFFYNMIFPLL